MVSIQTSSFHQLPDRCTSDVLRGTDGADKTHSSSADI